MPHRRRPIGAIALVVAATLVLMPVTAAHAETEYPSWNDVQEAKKNEKSKQAQIDEIEALIANLESDAAEFSRAALERAEEYNIALDALDDASARSERLERQASAAAETAAQSRLRAGQIIAAVARSGNGDVTLGLLSGLQDPDDLLYSLGAVSTISTQTARVYERAQQDANSAALLTEQAERAEAERKSLTAEAKSTLEAAKSAARDAQKKSTAQDAAAAQLYAQLASLKGTTSAIEKGYLEGVAWEKAQEAVTEPPVTPPPVNPTPEPPTESAVTGAIAFARAQLGDKYVLNGEGPDQWDCSGLTLKSYAAVGVSIGTHSATNQYATMQKAKRLVPFDEIVAGDLIFYSSGGSTTATKYHVALYIGAGQMIEAPYPGQPVRIKAVRYGDLVPYAGRPTP